MTLSMLTAAPKPAHRVGRGSGGVALVLSLLGLLPLARGFSFPPHAGLVSSGRLEGSAWPRQQGAVPPQTSAARRARRVTSLPAFYARHTDAAGGDLRLHRVAAERGGLLATRAERRGGSGMRR